MIATKAIIARHPRLIVNYGTAGKVSDGIVGLVEVAHVIQREVHGPGAQYL